MSIGPLTVSRSADVYLYAGTKLRLGHSTATPQTVAWCSDMGADYKSCSVSERMAGPSGRLLVGW